MMVKHEKSPLIEDKKEIVPTEPPVQKKNKPVKLLIFLITAIIILDVISLFVYFQPQFFSSDASQPTEDSSRCKDGTLFNECSQNKPFFCYNGELLEKAFTCGCPKGYVLDFQSCKKM